MTKPTGRRCKQVPPTETANNKNERRGNGTLTQREVLGVEPAPHQVAHHEPEVGHARVAPHVAQLALLVEPPHRLHARREVVPQDLLHRRHWRVEAG